MESLLRDLRLAARHLVKNPWFSAAVVTCLALGVGVTSAMFTLVNAVLLKPLPYREPDRVMLVQNQFVRRNLDRALISGHEFLDYRRQVKTLTGLSAWTPHPVTVTGRDAPERLSAARVSASLFPMLGVSALHGRTFAEEEDVYGQNGVAVLSYTLWQRLFGEDLAALDQTLTLNGQSFKIIGVLPADLRIDNVHYDLYIPIAINLGRLPPRTARGLYVAGRLSDGVNVQRAQEEMDRVAQSLQREYPDAYPADSGWGIRLVDAKEDLVGPIRPALLVLFAGAALVLLVACVNVANLLLARATAREKEVAIRTALGASRGRLFSQFTWESLLYSLAGGALGLVLGQFLVRGLLAVSPARLPRVGSTAAVGLDLWGVLFTLGIAVITGLIFGLVPVARAVTPKLWSALKEGGKTSDGGARGGWARRALVVAEIALALTVLVGAVLLVQSFRRLERVDPGFSAADVQTFRLFLGPADYPEPARRGELYRQITAGLAAAPGVEAAGAVSHLPLAGGEVPTGDVVAEGQAAADGTGKLSASWSVITPGYLDTLRIRRLQGRDFESGDVVGAPPVVLIDEALAKKLFADESPLDRRIQVVRFDGPSPWARVVGVVAPVKLRSLAAEGRPHVYFPAAQAPFPMMTFTARAPSASATSGTFAGTVREVVRNVDRNLPVAEPRPLQAYVTQSVSNSRLNALLLTVFGLVALALAVVGVYGVMSYAVSQRIREIGVRMALGAQARDVVALIVRQGLWVAGAGILVGLVLAFSSSRVVESLLYGVTATDLLSYAAVALLLAVLAAFACYLPARRAARVDPLVVLKAD